MKLVGKGGRGVWEQASVWLEVCFATWGSACALLWFMISPPNESRFEEEGLGCCLKLLALELHLGNEVVS